MKLLPNAENVVIPIEKFRDYALNHERKPDKAAAFMDALGYDLSNVQALINNLRKNIKNFRAIEKPDNGYGIRYEVMMTLTGINGKKANVLTAWIIDRDTGKTRLISAYVTKKRLREV